MTSFKIFLNYKNKLDATYIHIIGKKNHSNICIQTHSHFRKIQIYKK